MPNTAIDRSLDIKLEERKPKLEDLEMGEEDEVDEELMELQSRRQQKGKARQVVRHLPSPAFACKPEPLEMDLHGGANGTMRKRKRNEPEDLIGANDLNRPRKRNYRAATES